MLSMDNGKRIKEMRENAGVKATKLAEWLGVSRSYLSQIETGIRPASNDLLNKVATLLNVTEPQKADTPSPSSSSLSSLEARLGEVERKLGTIESLLLQILDRLKIKNEL